jgi:uncharacterized protein (DUF4415 family)
MAQDDRRRGDPETDTSDTDSPELDATWFQQARPATEVLPTIFGPAAAELLKPRRGRQKAPTKVLTSIRLDPDVVAHFKADGDGWQRRVNEALRKVAGLTGS